MTSYRKICCTCKESLPGSAFYYRASTSDGCSSSCSNCERNYARKRLQENPKIRARVREQARKRHITPEGMESYRISSAKYTMKHRAKKNAHRRLGYAIRTGKLSKPTECSKCGDVGRIEGHHEDYSKALDVTWLCISCHRAVHMTERDQAR